LQEGSLEHSDHVTTISNLDGTTANTEKLPEKLATVNMLMFTTQEKCDDIQLKCTRQKSKLHQTENTLLPQTATEPHIFHAQEAKHTLYQHFTGLSVQKGTGKKCW
jgi:hypothetical protein